MAPALGVLIAVAPGWPGHAAASGDLDSLAVQVSHPSAGVDRIDWAVGCPIAQAHLRFLRAVPRGDSSSVPAEPARVVAEVTLSESSAGVVEVPVAAAGPSAYFVECSNGSGEVRQFGPFRGDYPPKPAGQDKALVSGRGRAKPAGPIGGGVFEDGQILMNLHAAPSTMATLTVDQIAQATGVDMAVASNWLADATVHVAFRGVTVPTVGFGSPSTSRLVFRVPDLLSPYSREAVLQLVAGLPRAPRAVDATPAGGNAASTGFASIRFEEDRVALTTAPGAADDDIWFWESLSAAAPSLARRTHLFQLPNLDTAGGRGAVELEFASTSVARHSIDVTLNGLVVRSDVWSGGERRRVLAELPATAFLPGTNTLILTNRGDRVSTVHLDAFTVRYPRRLVADAGRCEWIAASSGPCIVDGFESASIEAWNVTDDSDPARLAGTVVSADGGGGFRLRLQVVAGHRYAAFLPGRVSPGAEVAPAAIAGLRSVERQAECVVIALERFREGAEALVRLRREGGLETVVVTLESIRDEFAGGNPDPWAIRSFLAATRGWRRPPRQAVILGDGTYDYRGSLGFADNLVPPPLVLTPFGRYPSDITLGDFDQDGVPEVIVGRLPVKTSEEVEVLVAKLRRREALGFDAARKAVLLADTPGEAGDFIQDSEALRTALAARFPVETIYNADNRLGPVREAVMRALGAGPALFNYAGHGARDRFGNGYLVSTDVAGLAALSGPPLVVAMTCGAGQFGVPGFDCLGEVLALRGDGGAAAVWSPSGFSINASAHVLNRAFADVVATAMAGDRLGDLIGRTFRRYRERGGDPVLGSIYNLIGDPGMPAQLTDQGVPELVLSIRHDEVGNGAVVEWVGGLPPYTVQRRDVREESSWVSVATTSERRWLVPPDIGAFLVRVVGGKAVR